MRPVTLAQTAERIASGQSLDKALPEFIDEFYLAATPELQIPMLLQEPPLTGDARVDGLLGGVAEYLAHQFDLPKVPVWAYSPVRYLDRAWHASSMTDDGFREYLTFASPAEFASRNIFTEERPLRRPVARNQPRHRASMIIAIDGPAASGKGTLGKRLAHHYHYRHLDTGVIYRAVAKALLDAGADLTDENLAVAAAMELDPEKFGNPALKTQLVGEAASVVSAIPRVREALINFQRQFAADPPGAVLDGRDIGTVICPHADVKIFVIADPKVRARRRTLEALARGEPADEAAVLADILKRDERDQNRATAPLKAAADAHLLDNSHLDIEGGVRAAIDIVEAVRAGRLRV